ncbi:DUF4864 domain-containing protein [Pseudooceanicola sp.]|uniref:DUF4864 domain-containing protein n=1 Tax=Pseudooceanicola sp. TaxID=1914328 RepID=UPI00262B5E3D|nr:DUF4864 domain-containing protein [Pseudooceanicola sp.]MDF1854551.1 DUF4864 domain-containing protein [Pseudooceanicola sp.]
MRQLMGLIAVMIGLAAPASGQSAAIQSVISAQIADFQADDFDAAFEHASRRIQGWFVTPQNFGAMVRQAYPMVHRPREFRFLDLQAREAGLNQIVAITDASGHSFLLRYEMIVSDRGWKIDGVYILPPQDLAT